ncbi:hypothetical protein Tco_0158895 [Tanacetum coccineum]
MVASLFLRVVLSDSVSCLSSAILLLRQNTWSFSSFTLFMFKNVLIRACNWSKLAVRCITRPVSVNLTMSFTCVVNSDKCTDHTDRISSKYVVIIGVEISTYVPLVMKALLHWVHPSTSNQKHLLDVIVPAALESSDIIVNDLIVSDVDYFVLDSIGSLVRIGLLAEGDLRKFSDIGAWYAIEDYAQYDKKCSNPTSAISDETIANPNAQIVRDDMVRVQVPREFPSFDKPEPQPQPLPNCTLLDASLGTERGLKPPIKPQSPDSFRMKVLDNLTIHTPPSPLVASFHLKDLYCYYRPCVDDPKKHYGFKAGLLGHSGSLGVDFLNMEMIEDDWELEPKEVSFLGRRLNLPVRPKEAENVIFDEKKLGIA